MTVTSQTPRNGPYSGNGSTDAFAYTFQIDAEGELVVVLANSSGVETVQTLTTHYTVSGVGNAGGGTVTMVTPPASGDTLSIKRAVTTSQSTDLQNRGAVIPQTLEDTFDDIVRMVQDLDEKVGRAVTTKLTANLTGLEYPTPTASTPIGWNATGTGLANIATTSATIAASTDNAVMRYDASGGGLQDSSVVVDDSDNVTGVAALTVTGNITVGGTVDGVDVATLKSDFDTLDAATSGTNTGDETTATTSAEGVVELATAAEIRNNTASKALSTDQLWSAYAEVTLSDGANISFDMDSGLNFVVTLAGNRTLDNPTNEKVGQSGYIRVIQDATGSRTLSYDTHYEFVSGTEPVLTTTASAEDMLFYQVVAADRVLIMPQRDIQP